MTKPKMCRKFHLAGRSANLARNVGAAMVSSAKECLELKRANQEAKIEEAEKELKRLETDLSIKEWC